MIYRGSGLNQASFDCPCSKTKLHLDYACGPRPISTTVEKCSSVRVIFMCAQFEGMCQGYDCTVTSVLLLLGKPLHALFQNGMRFGWHLLADMQTFPPAPAGSGSLC